jgi:hypothetical protein
LTQSRRAIAHAFQAQLVEVVQKPASQALLLEHSKRRQREDAQPCEGNEEALP